jgi:hypothetical protein
MPENGRLVMKYINLIKVLYEINWQAPGAAAVPEEKEKVFHE